MWAFRARRDDRGPLLGKETVCAARRGALPFWWKGHLFRLSGRWLLRIAEEFSRYTLPTLSPRPHVFCLKSDRKMGKVSSPLLPSPFLLTVRLTRGKWFRENKGQESRRRRFFSSLLRPFWPQAAKLIQFIDAAPSLAFDEPGRISQHISELARRPRATNRWKPGGVGGYCSDFPGRGSLTAEWRKAQVSEL